MQRYGMVIGLKPEAVGKYRACHAAVPPEVLATIGRCNIRNYSIYLKDNMLYSYFEYHGTDFAAAMAAMAADPATQRWWALIMPMQAPVATRREGEWWAGMEEVFHQD